MSPETDHPEETKLEGDQLPAEPADAPHHDGAGEDDAAETETPAAAEGEAAPSAEGGEQPEVPAAPAEPDNKLWYVVKVASGREESIKDAIERRVKIEGIEDAFGQIVIPVERRTELTKGNKRVI
jgi:transcriptional antiterminator NusG